MHPLYEKASEVTGIIGKHIVEAAGYSEEESLDHFAPDDDILEEMIRQCLTQAGLEADTEAFTEWMRGEGDCAPRVSELGELTFKAKPECAQVFRQLYEQWQEQSGGPRVQVVVHVRGGMVEEIEGWDAARERGVDITYEDHDCESQVEV